MPKFKTFLGSYVAHTESQRPLTHALIGQLDIEQERPPAITEHRKLTPEEADLLTKFEKKRLMGHFEPKVLDWFESEEDAEKAKGGWNRINFVVRKIDVRIP